MVTGGEKNMNSDSLLIGNGIGSVDNPLIEGRSRKRKQEDCAEDDKVTDTIVLVSSGMDVTDCDEETSDHVIMKTYCLLEHFATTMSFLSEKKLDEGARIGLGSLMRLRCTKLNLKLCQNLVQNFDVPNGCIRIHGRNLTFSVLDIGRLTSLNFWGRAVEVEGKTENPEILSLKKRISGNEDITINKLRSVLIQSENVDATFRSCLALYVMATLLFPVAGVTVDPRYLIPVMYPEFLCVKNWAQFAFNKLVEEVLSFQQTGVGLRGECLLFLQLFYLDAVRNGMITEKELLVPVITWEATDVERVLDMVESLGGWESTKVSVSKRHILDDGSDNIGTYDKSTGIRNNVVDDLSEVWDGFSHVKFEFDYGLSSLRRLGPEVGRLRSALASLERSLNHLESGGLHMIVSDAVRRVLEDNQNNTAGRSSSLFGCPEFEKGTDVFEEVEKHISPGVKSYGDGTPDKYTGGNGDEDVDVIPKIETKITPVVASPCLSNGRDSAGSSCFGSVADISQRESFLLTYLFSQNVSAYNPLGSDEVARFGGWSVSRWELSCLSPRQCVNAEVVNMSAAYLSDEQHDNWFMPATLSERAKEVYAGSQLEAVVPSIISTCRLHRFVGRLSSCRKIFFPIYDVVSKHWFLAVADMLEGTCEIWDSAPVDWAKKRRHDYAFAAISLVEKLFGNDCVTSPAKQTEYGQFCVSYPTGSARQCRSEDSGVYMMRNMKYYRQRWYEGFNSGDQRVRLALETVNDPRNEIFDQVWLAAEAEAIDDVPTTDVPPLSRADDGSVATAGIKFNARRCRR